MQERRHPLITLDRATLIAMLAPLVPAEQIASYALLTGGYSNTHYRVWLTVPPHQVVLRLHAMGSATARKEWLIAQWLQNQIPLAAPLYADLAGSNHGTPYTILAWVQGPRLLDLLQTAAAETVGACACAAGQTLAAIHAHPFPAAGFFGPDLTLVEPLATDSSAWQAYITQCVFAGHGKTWLGAERTARLQRFVAAHLAEFDTLPAQITLVHADYKGQNLLMRQEQAQWQTAAVLDWEFAFAGWPLLDFAIFLRDEANLPPSYAAQFVQGYRGAGGALPPNWHRLCKLLDLFNLCDFLNHPTERPLLVAQTIRYLDATMAALGE
jgi:aminoglycoside phosphotransferase (APT) family kinase protein